MAEGTITLGPDEIQALLAITRRQIAWEPGMPARLRSSGSAIGLYTVPPFDVLALFAVPAQVDREIDATIPLASLATALEIAAANGSAIDLARISETQVPVTRGMSVRHLPPAEGWHLPIKAVSGDVLAMVDEAVAEFTRRGAGQAEVLQQQIADEIWGRQAWAALPMRMLHAAARLGMLANDRSRVSAAVNGNWKRLTTARGHILLDTSVQGMPLPLGVLR